jgi:multidrug efflux pump subunit AcrB
VAQSVLVSLVGSNAVAPIPFTDPRTGNSYRINVRLDDAHRSRVDDLSEVFVRAPRGQLASLSALARVRRAAGPVQITRKAMQRVVDVTGNVAPGRDLGAVADAVDRVIAAHPPPDGFTVRLTGQVLAQREAFAGLKLAGLLALALVYMVLASQFRSLVDPLVIMLSVPLGVSGVLVALTVTGTTLSVNSFMGVIMMVGIVVSNGVLLVDFANVLRRRGTPMMEAVVEAGRTRLRPIVMTTVATVVGLLPMAAGLGEGSETNLPLARAVIGGLTVSTFFTLFLVPALYTALDRFARRTSPLADEADAPGEPDHA